METWYLDHSDPEIDKLLKEKKTNKKKKDTSHLKISIHKNIAYLSTLIMLWMDIWLMKHFFDLLGCTRNHCEEYGYAFLYLFIYLWLWIIFLGYSIIIFISKKHRSIYWLLFNIVLFIIWIAPALILLWILLFNLIN